MNVRITTMRESGEFVISNPPAIDGRPTASMVDVARRKLATAKRNLTRLENKRRHIEMTGRAKAANAMDRSIGAARRERDRREKHWRELETQLLAPEIREPMRELAQLLLSD